MLKLTRMPTWLVWTLCIAILATRVSGAHLHLCFDGQQPQSSIQTGQAGSDEFRLSHDDKDVSLVVDALVKSIDSKVVLPILLVAAVLASILSMPRNGGFIAFSFHTAVPAARGYHLRPPLRGPPL